MYPVGTQVLLKEGTTWEHQSTHDGKRHSGTIVANIEDHLPDYRYGDLLDGRDKFDYAVLWDFQKDPNEAAFYPEDHLYLFSVNTNEEALTLLNKEE